MSRVSLQENRATRLRDRPGTLTCSNRRYQKAFVDFYEDELVRLDYDWKEVVAEYLFSGENPIFNSLIADRTFTVPCTTVP